MLSSVGTCEAAVMDRAVVTSDDKCVGAFVSTSVGKGERTGAGLIGSLDEVEV